MTRGPGNPNTLYFGSDVLYRSSNGGTSVTKVSQEPITSGQAISAIGISPQNDNVRVVGMTNGGLFGTTTGASPLTDLDAGGTVPNAFIGRVVIDPNDSNTAYVTLSTFGVATVWKTNNLNNAAPTWIAAAGTGTHTLPQVPVNSFIVDPLNSSLMYAGTDIGVYVSGDAGDTWIPFGTALPRVAVFGMAISSGRMLKIATHGRGLWQIPLFGPTAAPVTVAGRVVSSSGMGVRNALVSMKDNSGETVNARTNTFGYFRFNSVRTGQTYVLSVQAKGYSFQPRALSPTSDMTDLLILESSARSSVTASPSEQPTAISATKVESPTVAPKTEAVQPVTSSVTKLTVVNTGSTKHKRKLRKSR
jgi:hypothetical protein